MPYALVYGLGQAGESLARQLLRQGWSLKLGDDSEAAQPRADALGLDLDVAADPMYSVRDADVVAPGPGVPIHHPIIQTAIRLGIPVWSEFEFVSRWGHPPLVAVTGTNGKTTVCTLVTDMLAVSGKKVVAAGNNELPLVDALDLELDLIVVEASSFRLEFTETFRPVVGTWLNVSDDHLDWHGSLSAYVSAKAKLWAHQRAEDRAIANADDARVLDLGRHAPSHLLTFALGDTTADAHLDGDDLVVMGDRLIGRTELKRSWPHDVSNALAAALTAISVGASVESCGRVLREFGGLPHRVELIGDAGGVRFYDDSKATTPASVVTAVAGFDSVVLIAGGRNKGLDLGALNEVSDRVRAVIAIGEAAHEVERAFGTARPVFVATSMDDAVRKASEAARPGDAVLLSPGCSSFDWYRNYAERGDDFARAVHALVEAG